MNLTIPLASLKVMHTPSRLFDALYECTHGRNTTKPATTRVIQRLPQEAVESSGVEFAGTGFSAEGASMLSLCCLSSSASAISVVDEDAGCRALPHSQLTFNPV